MGNIKQQFRNFTIDSNQQADASSAFFSSLMTKAGHDALYVEMAGQVAEHGLSFATSALNIAHGHFVAHLTDGTPLEELVVFDDDLVADDGGPGEYGAGDPQLVIDILNLVISNLKD